MLSDGAHGADVDPFATFVIGSYREVQSTGRQYAEVSLLTARCWSVMAGRDGGLGRFEACLGMCAVAERFGRGPAAAAERKGSLGYGVRCTIPVDYRYVIALHQVGSVLDYLDRRHRISPCFIRMRQPSHA